MSKKVKEIVEDDKGGEKAPMAFQISRQLDQEKINFLSKRVEELIRSNSELRSSATQNEKDTHDIVLYFQREMEIKDEIILRLNEELVKCQTQLKFEVEKARKAFDEEIAELRLTSETKIATLSAQLTDAENELKAIESYRLERHQHEELIQDLNRSIQQQRDQFIDAMEEQERRFLEEKSQLFKDLEDEKMAFRDLALREARSLMGDDMKKIISDNERLHEELRFHQSESSNFQAEKNTLVSELQVARREAAIFAEKEIEYAKQAYNRSKEIKVLRERVEILEKQQALNVEKFKQRAKELKATVTKELEEATLDAAGLRRLIQIKNKELRHMKTLAATILSQRTETEQFFLEALQEVKEVIKQERKTKVEKPPEPVKSTITGTNTTFPPLNIKAANLHLLEPRRTKPELSPAELEKVTITDLAWEDKELVLRVLFAKMNGSNQNSRQNTQYNRMSARPVFISEGVELPGADLQHFEIPTEQDQPPLAAISTQDDDYYSTVSSNLESKVMLPNHKQTDAFLASFQKKDSDEEVAGIKNKSGGRVRIQSPRDNDTMENASITGQSMVSSIGSKSKGY